jgi:hypothetical protein
MIQTAAVTQACVKQLQRAALLLLLLLRCLV